MGVYLHMMEGRAFIQRDHCHLHLGHLKLLCKMRGLVLVEAKGIAGAIVFVLKTHLKFRTDVLYVLRRERVFKVVIKFAARADLHHLAMFLAGRQPDAPQ